MLERLFRLEEHNTSVRTEVVAGILAHTLFHALTGRLKDISLTMWILAVLFVIRFFIA